MLNVIYEQKKQVRNDSKLLSPHRSIRTGRSVTKMENTVAAVGRGWLEQKNKALEENQ